MRILHSSKQIMNMTLRGLTLLSKFVLIFFLGRYLEPDQLGLYGLLTATIAYALYLLGFDFYIFTTREILKKEKDEWGGILKDQAVLSGALYLIFLPLLSLIFFFDLLPWKICFWFYLLLIFEHITQELSRLLVAISDQVFASIIIFLRQGLWGIVVVFLMYTQQESRHLELVLGAWALGSLASLLLSLYRLKKMNISGWSKPTNYKWMLTGLKTAIPFLVATLAIRGLFTLDRYWFEYLTDLETLGCYVLFIGISNALMSFLDAGIFSFIYPELIRNWQKQLPEKFSESYRKLTIQTVALSLGFSLIALICIEPFLNWLNKPFYAENIHLFPWLLVVLMLYAIGMIPHYCLYAQGKDKPIIYSNIAGFLVFLPSTCAFSIYSPQLAVPLGLCLSFLVIFAWKTWSFFKLTPVEYRNFKHR